MKLAIMQPYIFPYIGYFQLINAVDKFIILDDVNFINKGWINRNYILINNKRTLFTIPLEKASQNKKINEIYIIDDNKWRQKLLKTIELAYKKAPFFENVFELISGIINYDKHNISVFNVNALNKILDYLNVSTEIVSSSSIYKNSELKGETRIIDICEQEKATNYINPIGGNELYNKSNFQKSNIHLNFIKTNKIEYPQFKNSFTPGLSIIDMLMFCSPEEMKSFLMKYSLK
jgi:hypothetical protein